MTAIIKRPTHEEIRFAADVLRNGGLVAFPTETVYGLGANGLDKTAVAKIFEAKGRPSDNPLILHIVKTEQLNKLVREIPNDFYKLEKFFPGPLTVVLKKADMVPDIVTAGLDTVAVRFPANKIAQDILRESDVPIAAPSANISGKPSPTEAQHVIDDLNGKIDIIIDGGKCDIGLESTVLDLSGCEPCILREGKITKEQLEGVLGSVETSHHANRPKAPGMKYRHYAPESPLYITDNIEEAIKKCSGKRVGVLTAGSSGNFPSDIFVAELGVTPDDYAANLFACLRQFDEASVDIIIAQDIKGDGVCEAVRNRLYKASGGRI